MVAPLGLLDAGEVRVEVLLGEPRGAVDALEHRACRVAAPVRAGDLHELERADPAGARDVRPAAQVGEVALAVGGDGLALGQLGDELALVRLLFEGVERLEPVELGAREGLLLGDDLVHALLDRLEVLGRERATDVEVVVEAVLDRRADAELGHREEVLDGLGHHVSRRVAQDVECFGALVGDDLDRVAVGDHLGTGRRARRRSCPRRPPARGAARSKRRRRGRVEPSATCFSLPSGSLTVMSGMCPCSFAERGPPRCGGAGGCVTCRARLLLLGLAVRDTRPSSA